MKKIILVLFTFSVILSSCTKNFEDFNTDKKNPPKVAGEFLFTNAQKELVDQISSTNVNLNVWKLFAQYWTETTYTDEANYDIINRSIPDHAFDTYYRRVLKPLSEAKRLITEDPLKAGETEEVRANKLAIIELMEVYAYHNLVMIFGDVPYSEALDIENISPKYDDAATICKDLVARIDAAYASMDESKESFGSADLYYDGDVSAWKKFAMSLKLKIAVTIADAASESGDWVADAVTKGVFTSASDNALLHYEGSAPNTNPLYEDLVASGRKDFVLANTLVDLMNNFQDPRIFKYMSDPITFPFVHAGDTTIESGDGMFFVYSAIDGSDSIVYKPTPITLDSAENAGVRYFVGGNYGHSSSYGSFAHIHPSIQAPDFPGILMTYSEVEFYIAEAAARGFSVGQAAADAYNEAIRASFAFWGASAVEADAYIASPAVAYDATKWKELIGTQAYLASYTRGFVAYTTYRRLDFPVMNEPPAAATGGPVPTRFTYPVNEQTLNADNYQAAAEAIGGDDMLTKLFWDKY